jgi:hypothetical protein
MRVKGREWKRAIGALSPVPHLVILRSEVSPQALYQAARLIGARLHIIESNGELRVWRTA